MIISFLRKIDVFCSTKKGMGGKMSAEKSSTPSRTPRIPSKHTHVVFPKFEAQQIEDGCIRIFGKGFNELTANELQWLIQEYDRLGQLPTLRLVSNTGWINIIWDEEAQRYERVAI